MCLVELPSILDNVLAYPRKKMFLLQFEEDDGNEGEANLEDLDEKQIFNLGADGVREQNINENVQFLFTYSLVLSPYIYVYIYINVKHVLRDGTLGDSEYEFQQVISVLEQVYTKTF